jgi:ribosomal protein L22
MTDNIAKLKAYDEEQARLYKEKLDMGLLVGSGVKPNLKEISKHFVKQMKPIEKALRETGKAAKKTSKVLNEVAESARPKKEYVRPPHLTHRPFKTPEMQLLSQVLHATQR